MLQNRALNLYLLAIVFAVPISAVAEQPAVDFARQIRPILANNCFACHGPDEKKREADLRLDRREVATGKLESGSTAIVAGNVDQSALLARINHADPEQRMPPAELGKQLNVEQKQLLARWIREGAKYDVHWSFIAPTRANVPVAKNKDWGRNEIDGFVLSQLEQKRLSPAPGADRATLARRVSFDLRGLPPTLEEVDEFLADQNEGAYERMVDRMLKSPHFGEKLAMDWLDLARYGDTNGFHADSDRSMWLYRDWVIYALNTNMPFDQFVREQIAGDLMPSATTDQLIASGFNRNNTFNEEGGADPDEFYVAYAVDRANTTAQAFLGLTFGCAQCHDHKYDPISQKEYYQFYSFFNSVEGEVGAGGSSGYHNKPLPPLLKAPSPLNKSQNASTMIMKAMAKRRPAFVLARGDFQQPGERVESDVPAIFPRMLKDKPRNRLGLAHWLTRRDHPLVSRVRVNHLWKQLFGVGLVQTAGDLGTQGELPSHPELLDWLAVEFVENGWDTKALLKKVVMSATYRQSSSMKGRIVAADPLNRLLYRAPRFRFSAEVIRDNLLAISGLLNREIGGPSVRPYQPAGFYSDKVGRKYDQSKGKDLYRRGLYTYWRRTAPYPSFIIFDAPSREFCTASRPRTNTPLQALVLMNDTTFVEAARVFAQRIMNEGGATFDDRLTFAFRCAVSRSPMKKEVAALSTIYQQQLTIYAGRKEEAAKLIANGQSPADEKLDRTELAAWTIVACIMLNLDETITRE
jgi:mono/diheme cytochrome c family protein